MIYSIQWASVCRKTMVSEWNKELYPDKQLGDIFGDLGGKEVADFIKESKDSTFLFSLSNYAGIQGTSMDQKPTFDEWVKTYGLEKYVKFVSAGISNPVHQERKYSIYVAVLQSEDTKYPLEVKGMVQ